MAHAIIFPSAVIRDRVYASFLLGVPKQRLHVVPPGLDPPEQQAAQAEPEQEKRPLRRSAWVRSILAMREADLIKAVASLRNLSIECQLVGQMVKLDEDAEEIARKSPRRFTFVGQLPHAETMRLLDRSDIFAFASSSRMPAASRRVQKLGAWQAILLSDLPAHEGIWRMASTA